MNKELKAGDIVKIENAYFKNENGLYFVDRCPGDAGWCGNDYSLKKICKNGKISTAKYSICFWPISVHVNDSVKRAAANEWNKEYATITKVEGINTEYVIEHFKEDIEAQKEQIKYYSWNWGDDNETVLHYKEILRHYENVVARMTGECAEEERVEEEKEEVQEAPEQSEVQATEEATETEGIERIYYTINEHTAKLAKEVNSFSSYKDGEATEEYRYYCDKAYDILDKIKEEKPEQVEKATHKVDYYCRKLAEYYNDYYRNETSCPSILISGGSNFPVKKKNKQNSRRETLNNTWKCLENYLQKIENILTYEQPIKSGDSDAIERLKAKIERLEADHKMHMECNRYYKKHGTLQGFGGLERSEAEKIEDFIKRNPTFPPFITYNETANIRRYKERLEKLTKEKQAENIEAVETDEENNELYTAIENTDIMRLQIIFDDKPEATVRDILKSNGFRWSPKNKAWQRQLTDNARYSYNRMKNKLREAMLA